MYLYILIVAVQIEHVNIYAGMQATRKSIADTDIADGSLTSVDTNI